MNWRALHLIVGTTGLLLFVLQGQYMGRVLVVPELPELQRMLYRSGHIYLMLACAANICAGYYLPRAGNGGLLRALCSLLLLAPPPMLLLSFFTESSGPTPDRPLASTALYMLFAAAALLASHAMWLRLTGRAPPGTPAPPQR